MDLQIEGLEDTITGLLRSQNVATGRGLARAIDRAVGVIAAEVEARAPEREEGLLKENVITKTAVDVTRGGGVGVVGFSSATNEEGKPADLVAYWVEFGHIQTTHDGKAVGHVPAYPFMRPAFDASADRATEVFADVLIESLSEA